MRHVFRLNKLNHSQATKFKAFHNQIYSHKTLPCRKFFKPKIWNRCQKISNSWAIWQFNLGFNFLMNKASSTFLPNQAPVLFTFRILKQPIPNLTKLSCFDACSLMAKVLLTTIYLPVFHDIPICLFTLNVIKY